jgi:rhodanese-related sulfurtransferase
LIPTQEIERRLGELVPHKSKAILAYCRTGHRSDEAQRLLKEHGFKVLDMAGGILRWNEEQLPVVKEKHH